MTSSVPAVLWVPALVILVCAAWVYRDASSRQESGHEVTVTVGTVTIEQPSVWTALCVVLYVVAFPLYLVARNADG